MKAIYTAHLDKNRSRSSPQSEEWLYVQTAAILSECSVPRDVLVAGDTVYFTDDNRRAVQK